MIQFQQSLGDAYVRPARNVMLPSTPGRQVRFMQGHAVIKHGHDMVAMLRRPDVRIVLTPYALSWWDTWAQQVGERIEADVVVPDEPSWDPSLRSEVLGTSSTDPDQGA